MGDPHAGLTHAGIRPLKLDNPVDVAQLSPKAIKPQDLKFNPEIVSAGDDDLALAQPGGNLATLFVLLGNQPEAKSLIATAAKEQQMIGGTAGV